MATTILVAIALVGTVCSCADEQLVSNGGISLNRIVFQVGTAKATTETRAASEKSKPTDLEAIRIAPIEMPDGDTLYLKCTVSDIEDPFQEVEVAKNQTRGAMITTDNIATKYGSFKIDGYRKSVGSYLSGITVTKTADFHTGESTEDWRSWKMPADLSEDLVWPRDDDELTLYAWAPADFYPGSTSPVSSCTYTQTSGQYKGNTTFSYTSPTATGTDQAKVLKDLLFTTYGPAKAGSAGTGQQCITLQFHHMLSALQFREGDLKGGYVISQVVIKNVQPNGSCTYTAGTTPSITWSASGTRRNFTQAYNYAVDDDHLKATSDDASINTTNNDATFFFVPQSTGTSGGTTSSDIQIELTFKLKSDGTSYKRTISMGGMTWAAGKQYTYSLSLPDVSIQTSTTDNTIKNVGTSKCFIRAAVVGNWMEPSSVTDRGIVANWTDPIDFVTNTGNSTNDGAFSGLRGSNWTAQQDDGYFYYTLPVAKGASTTALFTSYAKGSGVSSPTHGFTSNIELDILVQAVQADANKTYITAAWGSNAASKVVTTGL